MPKLIREKKGVVIPRRHSKGCWTEEDDDNLILSNDPEGLGRDEEKAWAGSHVIGDSTFWRCGIVYEDLRKYAHYECQMIRCSGNETMKYPILLLI